MKALHTIAALIALGGTLITGAGAQSNRFDRQEEKNASRSVGIGLGVLALDQLTKGKGGEALLLGAAAAVAGKHYEDLRRDQDDDRRDYRSDRIRRERLERERRERLERERRERERREWERRERERLERERLERERERREWERRRDRWDDRRDRWDDRRDDRRDRDDDCRDPRHDHRRG